MKLKKWFPYLYGYALQAKNRLFFFYLIIFFTLYSNCSFLLFLTSICSFPVLLCLTVFVLLAHHCSHIKEKKMYFSSEIYVSQPFNSKYSVLYTQIIIIINTVEPRYPDTLWTRKKYRRKWSAMEAGVWETYGYKKLYFLWA